MELVAFVGNDKESWGQISGIVNRGEWEKVILVKSKSSESFPLPKNSELIEIDSSRPLLDLKEDMRQKIKKAIGGEFEVALSIASGNGKEHMAIISALLTIPVGIRLVVFTKNGIEFIN